LEAKAVKQAGRGIGIYIVSVAEAGGVLPGRELIGETDDGGMCCILIISIIYCFDILRIPVGGECVA